MSFSDHPFAFSTTTFSARLHHFNPVQLVPKNAVSLYVSTSCRIPYDHTTYDFLLLHHLDVPCTPHARQHFCPLNPLHRDFRLSLARAPPVVTFFALSSLQGRPLHARCRLFATLSLDLSSHEHTLCPSGIHRSTEPHSPLHIHPATASRACRHTRCKHLPASDLSQMRCPLPSPWPAERPLDPRPLPPSSSLFRKHQTSPLVSRHAASCSRLSSA
jgi:hypothetical protein